MLHKVLKSLKVRKRELENKTNVNFFTINIGYKDKKNELAKITF